MPTITLSQSLSNSPTFSFQDALYTYRGFPAADDLKYDYEPGVYGSGILYSAGCLVNNIPNCTAACQDPTLIFANTHTMQNCMVLASLGPTKYNANGSLTLQNQTLSPHSVSVATNFSIDLTDPGFLLLANNTNKTISECLQQYCDKHTCSYAWKICNWFDRSYHPASDGDSGASPTPYCYTDICYGNGSTNLNPDIGGIGVYISYWMQTGIAIILFIMLKMCDVLLYRTCLFTYGILWPCWFIWPLGLKRIKEKAHKAQTLLNRYQPAIKSATVEFHKAQCFFMLATGIAGQIVLRQGSLEDGSLQSLTNYTLVGIISINGVLPVTLTLLCLHTARMHSWYILILTTCTVVLSAVTFFMSGNFTPSAQDIGNIQAASDDSFDKCGNKDPSRFCLTGGYGLSSTPTNLASGIEGSAVVFSLVILGLLILDHGGLQEIKVVQSSFKRFFGRVESLLKPNPGKRFRHTRMQNALGNNTAQDYMKGLSNLLYLFIWTWYGVNIAYFLIDLGTFVPVKGWTFGQVVAITVWALPILEFVKLLAQGLKVGLEYRTPFPYKIIDSERVDEEPGVDIEETRVHWAHTSRNDRDIPKWKLKKYFIPPGAQPEELFKIF